VVYVNQLDGRLANARVLMPPFRQLGPLIAAAAALASFADGNTAAIAGTLPEDARRLAPLRRIVGWISRDSVNVGDMRGLAIEYLNMFLFLDRTALYFAAREITARRRELQRAIAAVGDIDAPSRSRPIATGTPGWTRPSFVPSDAPAILTAIRHPLIEHAVPNSATFRPPFGMLVDRLEHVRKTTFLRTVGVATVMAQTIATWPGGGYSAPRYVVRSVIGRSDDLLSARVYYAVEASTASPPQFARRRSCAKTFSFEEEQMGRLFARPALSARTAWTSTA